MENPHIPFITPSGGNFKSSEQALCGNKQNEQLQYTSMGLCSQYVRNNGMSILVIILCMHLQYAMREIGLAVFYSIMYIFFGYHLFYFPYL